MSDGERQDTAADASAFLPDRRNLTALRRAAASCRGCELYRDATQTVFGEGRVSSRMMIVGEQPGDREDREGAPFVGPAGGLLDKLLDEAGIDRREVYVTNAVKHFKWRRGRGKRRIHDKPSAGQIGACRPWLEAELDVIDPEVVVGLGATAGRALLGPKFRVTRDRGALFEPEEAGLEGERPLLTATLHPSALLRIDEESERRRARAEVVADLRIAAAALD